MELNVPTSGAVSHESPAVVQLHEDTKVPVSEIKAKLHNKVMELNHERLANPSEVPYGDDNDGLKEQTYKEVEDELTNPEEVEDPQTEEFKNFFGDTYPGADAFAAPEGEDDLLGGIGGDGDFGGGIDNNAMGFSDDDMTTLNDTADSAFDDFTADDSAETASDVNNLSAEEPGTGTDDVTDPAAEETPAEKT